MDIVNCQDVDDVANCHDIIDFQRSACYSFNHEEVKDMAMAESKQWLTQKEIADFLHLRVYKIYPRISALRRAGVIETKSDPSDDRLILVSANSLDIIKKALGIE
jgi:DNA-binding MarR family transcriptional regulator